MWIRSSIVLSVGLVLSAPSFAQQAAVHHVSEGPKAYFRIDPRLLRADLDTLFAEVASTGQQMEGLSWAAVLGNGTNPGVDVDFYGYEASGLGAVTTSGTFEGDSLVLNKDAEIAGRLEVVGVATIGDSLWVEGAVVLSDSLRVVKAVAVGSRLHVSGVSAFGDSVHVVGNVDLDALFHVNGAATFGSEVEIAGKLSAHDSVSFAGALEVVGVTSFGDSLIIEGGTAMRAGANVSGVLVADSIASGKVLNAQVRDLANHDTDGLTEGATNLYFTNERAVAAVADTIAYFVGVIELLHAALSFSCGNPVTHQGYDYATVEIGSQCWFAENLRATSYNDGVPITSGVDGFAWPYATDGATAVYDEGGANEAVNLAIYGRLYNWYAVNTGKLCPWGWRVPTDEDWTALTDALGGEFGAGVKMKTADWGGTNESGFSGLPGGGRYLFGTFSGVGDQGIWWSSSSSGGNSWFRMLTSDYGWVSRYFDFQLNGFSVRCVRD